METVQLTSWCGYYDIVNCFVCCFELSFQVSQLYNTECCSSTISRGGVLHHITRVKRGKCMRVRCKDLEGVRHDT